MGLRSFVSSLVSKVAPAIPGALGRGDTGGVDTWKVQRSPSKLELLQQYKSIVYACANINARAVASAPYRLYVQTNTGHAKARCPVKGISSSQKKSLKRVTYLSRRLSKAVEIEEVTDHPLLTLLQTVNDQIDGFELFELTDLYQELSGTCFWYLVKNGLGVPVEIWLIPSSMVHPFRDPMTGMVLYWLVGASRQVRYELDELLVFRFPNPQDPYGEGWSPSRAAWESVSLINKSYSKSLAMMENNARPDILFSPKEFLGGSEAMNLEKRLQQKFRRGGMGGIMVTDSAFEAKILNYSPRDMEMLALYGISKIELANAYDVPMSLLETKDVNRANAEAGHYQHAKLAIAPRVTRLGSRLTSKLCPMFDPTGRLFITFDNPVPQDETVRMATRVANLDAGVVTINEERAEDGLEPVEWGDKPWLSYTLAQPGEENSNAPTDAKPPKTDPEEEDDPEDPTDGDE